MRMIIFLAAGASLAFAVAANAQAPSTQQPSTQSPAATPAAPSAAPTSQRVNVVDIEELSEATQTQVNDVVAQRNETDLQKLRSSIDAAPEVKSALEAKGMTSANVILASRGADGALTLITKKAS